MQENLFSLALDAEELFANASDYYEQSGSETSTLKGIPTFSQDTILELINDKLANFYNIQSLLTSILGEANIELIKAIRISTVD